MCYPLTLTVLYVRLLDGRGGPAALAFAVHAGAFARWAARFGVLNDRRLNSGRRLLILADGQQRVAPSEATDDELTSHYDLVKIFRISLSD
jgi:hypothetical protein